jgi:hypothetical protein
VPVEQRIERVEKFLLRPLLSGKKMHVVNQQDIRLAEPLSEPGDRMRLQRMDELIREFLAGDVDDAPPFILAAAHRVANRMHQMRFSQSAASEEEQRIIGTSGFLCHRLRRRVGELIVCTHHKRVKRV